MTEPPASRRFGTFAPLFERHVLLGMVGVLLMFSSLGAMHLFSIPHLKALDEPRHIAYAIEIAEGRIPDVRDKVDLEKLHAKRIRGTKMHAAAAHPPLYYALVGFPLKWASQGPDMTWGLRVSRAITLLIGAAGLLYTYLALLLATPRSRSLALASTALCAFMPAFVNVCSIVHNDSVAYLTTAALLHSVLVVLLRGASFKAVVAVLIWAALAAASRFASMVVVAPALAAVGLKLLAATDTPLLLRLRNAALFSVSAVGLLAATSGWFYLRNYRMYGDVTAGKPLLAGLSRPIREPFYHHLLSLDLWHTLVSDLWCRLAGGVFFGGAIALLGTLFVVGGLAASLKELALRWRPEPRRLLRDPRTAAVVFVVLACLCVVVPIFEFYSRGGNLTARYYFPVLWIPLLAVAAGYGSFKSHLPGAAMLIGAGLASVWVTDLYVADIVGNRNNFAIAYAFGKAGLPQANLIACLLIVLVGVGLTLIVTAWHALRVAGPELDSGTNERA